jgi:tetratricopeptide (TPR) repeat protein
MKDRIRPRTFSLSHRTRRIGEAAILILLPVLAYIPAYDAGFFSDDESEIVRNERLRTPDGLGEIWTDLEGTDGLFYPLTFTTFWLEYRAWGASPAGYHIDNVLLHSVNALLVWLVLRRLGLPGSWLAGAVFALHPVNVETVAWVTERRNTLSTLFFLVSLLAYFGGRPSLGARGVETSVRSRRRSFTYLLSLAFFAAALLSKSATLSLPAVILLTLWWSGGPLRREIGPLVPFVALAAAAGLMTIGLERNLVDEGGPGWGTYTAADRVLLAGRAVWFYLGKLLFPARLSLIYPRWAVDDRAWSSYGFPVSVIAVLVILFLLRRRIGRGPFAAALLFVGTLLPVLGFVDFFYMMISFVADRFLYLPGIGIIALVVCGSAIGVRSLSPRVAGPAALAGILALALLGALTTERSARFKNPETLYRDVVAKFPNSWAGHYSLGANLGATGRPEEAIAHLERALQLNPNFPSIRGYLAVVYSQVGRYDEALGLYAEALDQNPRNEEIHTNLGLTYAQLGRFEEAIDHYQAALEIDRDYAPAIRNLTRLVLYRIDALRREGSADAGAAAVRMRALAAGLGLGALVDEIDRRDARRSTARDATPQNANSKEGFVPRDTVP